MSLPMRMRTALAVCGVLLAAAVTTSLLPFPASGQSDAEVAPPNREPKRPAPRRAKGMVDRETVRRQQQELIDGAAAKLGVTPERLNAALKDAHIDQVNKAVVEGKLSREQADRLIEQIKRGQGAAEPVSPAPAGAVHRERALSDITVSFKLDPRLTRSLYMGERWVSPSAYSGIQEGVFIVEARVDGVDAVGQPVDIRPEWTAADPTMVTVAPSRGKQVTITVRRAGETGLRVTAERVSKELSIKAWDKSDGLQAEISQKPVEMSPAK